jgi:hypothetical protein
MNLETPENLNSRRLPETSRDMALERRDLKSGNAVGELLASSRSREPLVKHGFWWEYPPSAKSVALRSVRAKAAPLQATERPYLCF